MTAAVADAVATEVGDGTYVLGVPSYKLSIVLLTNRQNIGPDARGYFPEVGPLQQAVSKAVVNGSAAPQTSH